MRSLGMSGRRSTCNLIHKISDNGFDLPLTKLNQWSRLFTEMLQLQGVIRQRRHD